MMYGRMIQFGVITSNPKAYALEDGDIGGCWGMKVVESVLRLFRKHIHC